jgi:hypothetical protein
MRTLELKDICGYVPHELKLFDKNGFMDCVLKVAGIMDGDIIFHGEHCKCKIVKEDEIKPILYPISSLYETRVHKGKEIIPIVECAKRSIHGVEWNNTVHKSKIVEDDYYILSYRDGYKYKFGYNKHEFWMEFQNKKFPVIQLPLFDYLNELKVDYRGLIESGLAIDVNTLEINPYK